ncbi:MAG: hypothetical protein J0H63_05420 [Rhizobiales bacterium]|nr:hypothetical protein [Hyphomicrobiales bacterium]
MRDLNRYSAGDSLPAAPAVAGFKELRDGLFREFYCAQPSPDLARFLAGHRHLQGGTFMVTIAFEQAWLIGHFLDHLARHMPGVPVIVADNSRTGSGSREIAAACLAGGGSYLKLPSNPIRNINRSHGNALNWVWRNIVRPLQPRVFGFLDHDIFPLAPVDVDALLGEQDFYGQKMDKGRGWAVWAGYSFYRFAALADRRLDFNPDMDRRLVAGGRNYGPLYRHYDPATLRFAKREFRAFEDPALGSVVTERIDGWVHFGGVSYQEQKMRSRKYLESLIAA